MPRLNEVFDNPEDFAEAISKEVNGGGLLGGTAAKNEFAQKILSDHRTLQALSIGLLFELLYALASNMDTKNTDQRNFYAYKNLEKFKELVDNGELATYLFTA